MLIALLLAQITAANAAQLQKPATAADAKSGILALAFSPDGSRLATADDRGGVQVWGLR